MKLVPRPCTFVTQRMVNNATATRINMRCLVRIVRKPGELVKDFAVGNFIRL
jgi:hypothetical protein